MTRPGFRWRLVAGGVAIILGVSACTSSSADGPGTSTSGPTASASVVDPSSGSAVTSSAAPSPTPSVIDVPTPSSAPPASLDPAAQEAADRAAIEAQWANYWDIYLSVARTDATELSRLAATVAVDPAAENLSKSAAYFQSKGQDTYGQVVHRLSWLEPINGMSEAVLSDCQDQSEFGSIDVATGQKLSVGVQRDNIKAHYVRGKDAIWRVSDIYYLVDTPC